MNVQAKTNRVLLIALTTVIAAVIGLVAVTTAANRRNKPAENTPPIGPRLEETPAKPLPEKTAAEEELIERVPQEKPAVREPEPAREEKAEEVVSLVPAEEIMPEFRVPVEGGVVIKTASPTVPVWSATMNDYRTHRGVDFSAAPGTAVLAAASGVVTEARRDPMMGVTVSVKHAGGAVSRYLNLAEESLGVCRVGQSVAAGELVGTVGETALIESAEENHLHFELEVDGKPVDPADYLSVVLLSDLPED